MLNYILGVDPGVNGALCLYETVARGAPCPPNVLIRDMPVHSIVRNGKKRQHIDHHGLARYLKDHRHLISFAYIENPQGMPGMASNSTYRLGFNVACVIQACASAEIPYALISPAAWKKHMRVGSEKDKCRARASELAPQSSELWARVKDDGRAEACLIAIYGMQQGTNNSQAAETSPDID